MGRCGQPPKTLTLSKTKNYYLPFPIYDLTASLIHYVRPDPYSLSCKTVNTRENSWNVYCFATKQMRDETAKDNGQTTAWISYDLTRNHKLAFSSMGNL